MYLNMCKKIDNQIIILHIILSKHYYIMKNPWVLTYIVNKIYTYLLIYITYI